MRLGRWLSPIAIVWLCAACAGPAARLPPLAFDEVAAEKRRQQITQLQDYYAQLHRIETVAFRIRTANREYCEDWIAGQIGLRAVTPQSLPSRYRKFSAEALDLRWVRATVISVVEGSPAASAGLKIGDELMTFNGEKVPVTGTSGWMARFFELNGTRPVQAVFRRDDTTDIATTIYPAMGCAIPVTLETRSQPGAHTDFSKIVVYSGMVRLARTDAQLAAVIGHELAHVNMGHYGKKIQNTILGTIAGAATDGGFLLGGISTGGAFTRHFGAAGRRAFSVGFEREADYIGAYYAARAGYDIAGTEHLWRAMSLEAPGAIVTSTTHPITAERFIQMQRVAAEIADKQRRQLPLKPELKVFQAQPEPLPPREGNF